MMLPNRVRPHAMEGGYAMERVYSRRLVAQLNGGILVGLLY